MKKSDSSQIIYGGNWVKSTGLNTAPIKKIDDFLVLEFPCKCGYITSNKIKKEDLLTDIKITCLKCQKGILIRNE